VLPSSLGNALARGPVNYAERNGLSGSIRLRLATNLRRDSIAVDTRTPVQYSVFFNGDAKADCWLLGFRVPGIFWTAVASELFFLEIRSSSRMKWQKAFSFTGIPKTIAANDMPENILFHFQQAFKRAGYCGRTRRGCCEPRR